jgi:exonuclease III
MLDCLEEQSITLASFNARGLRQARKRKIFYHHIRTNFPQLNILFLQETHLTDHESNYGGQPWPSTHYASSLSSHAGGVSIHLRTAWTDSLQHAPTFNTIIPGRAISCSFTANDLTKHHLLNVYAPTGATERQAFFQHILDHIQRNWGGDQIIMGGDMNAVLDPTSDRRPTMAVGDAHPNSLPSEDAGCSSLRRLVTVIGLQDIYRQSHPTARQYTCRNVSRIDRWYTTKALASMCSGEHPIPPPVHSDHYMITMTIKAVKSHKRGPGTWKANPNNWSSPEIREQIQLILDNTKITEHGDPFQKWLQVKREIKTILKTEGQRQASQRREALTNIQEEIRMIIARLNGMHSRSKGFLETTAELHRSQHKLERMMEKSYVGAAKRARIKHIQDGERYTKYFLSLARARARKKSIIALTDHQGNEVQEPKAKLKVGSRFYDDLYSEKHRDPVAAQTLLDSVPPSSLLAEGDRRTLEADFTPEEVTKHITSRLGYDKAPGPDGLTAEFYRSFQPLLTPILTYLFNHALAHPRSWSHHFTESQICLIHKKGPISEIKNYRPIALLNTDYKILTGIINARIRPIAPQLLTSTQTGFVKGRLITDCIHTVDLAIRTLEIQEERGLVLFLDQEKAYDRVAHEWLLQCLLTWNFPENVAYLIHALNASATTRLQVDGFLSKLIQQHSGVRQGCPLSPFLYNLTLEPLNCFLRSPDHSKINGFQLSNTRLTNIHYADDTTLLIPEGEEERYAHALELYQKASGAKLNTTKGIAIRVGGKRANKESEQPIPEIFRQIPILKDGQQCKYLGVPVPQRMGKRVELDWLQRSKSIHRIIQHWTPRATTLQGRVAVANSLLYSQLYYHASTRFLSPTAIHKLFSAPVHRFLWKNRRFHPNSNHLMASRKNGGWNLSSLPNRFTALRIKALASIVTRQDATAGVIRDLINALIPRSCPPLMALLQWPSLAPVKKTHLPQFWKQAILDTRKFLEISPPYTGNQWPKEWTQPQRHDAFLQLPVWNQPHLGTTGISPDPKGDAKHIKYVHHLLSMHQDRVSHYQPVQGIITQEYLWEQCGKWARDLDTTSLPIFDQLAQPTLIFKVNAGAALQWSPRAIPCPRKAPEPLATITTKQIYNLIQSPQATPTTLPGVWQSRTPTLLPTVEEWQRARTHITCSKLPPSLIESRWRLLMGQIPSNAIRHGWDPTIHPGCPRCGHPNETPEHLIWECPWAQDLWKLGTYIFQHWIGAPPHPISKLEGIWSIKPTTREHLGREVTVAFIGLTIWRSRWLITDEPPHNAPTLTTRISLLTSLGSQIEDIAATNLSSPYRQQIQTCPLLNEHGKTTPIPIRILQQAANT